MKYLILILLLALTSEGFSQNTPLDSLINVAAGTRTILFEGDRQLTGLPVLRTEPLSKNSNCCFQVVDTILKNLASWPQISSIPEARNRLYSFIRTNFNDGVERSTTYGFPQDGRVVLQEIYFFYGEKIDLSLNFENGMLSGIYGSRVIDMNTRKIKNIYHSLYDTLSQINYGSFLIESGLSVHFTFFNKSSQIERIYFMNRDGKADGSYLSLF